jgi:hypothetical protein
MTMNHIIIGTDQRINIKVSKILPEDYIIFCSFI